MPRPLRKPLPRPSTLTDAVLNNKAPSQILHYDKNCAAMTFSRVLGIGVYATINHFIAKGWISKGTQLENDDVIMYVINHLGLAEQYKDEEWRVVRTSLPKFADGKYFAMNYGPRGSTVADARGHAFAIVKQGGWAVYGNNSETPDKAYRDAIHETHKISVYGPVK